MKWTAFDDVQRWKTALANCAIEGNVLAQEMLELYETDRVQFVERAKQLLEEERHERDSKISTF